jgi:hypothetical protein
MYDLSHSNLFRQPKIPTINNVKEVFRRLGGTEEQAIKFYENQEVTGWFFNGSPIMNFTPLASRYIAGWNKSTAIRNERKLVL